jgi:lysyl endopeptidase
MSTRNFVSSVLTALPTCGLLAQLSFGGMPLGIERVRNGLPVAPAAVLPQVDAAALMAEDDARALSGRKDQRFGYTHTVDFSPENSGLWSHLSNGDRVWQLAIHCPGALSINLVFDQYELPAGARVFVHNGAEHRGAFTSASSPKRPSLAVAPLPGEHMVVEYQEPKGVAGEGKLHIGSVTHGYRSVFNEQKAFGQSGSCNVNTICPLGNAYQDQISSVARIISNGDWCTGQLINNASNDGTPYFLTANHCINSNVGNWVFMFNWESPTCSPTTNSSDDQTLSGADVLVQGNNADHALLLLDVTPPSSYDVFYTGWDKSGNPSSNSVAIHHPRGDIKKISLDEGQVSATTWGAPSAAVWRVASWEDGTTEPSSSGSGLWNPEGLLFGTLYGGTASCSNNINDYYGRFSVAYPFMDQWLGDPGPDGKLSGFEPAVSVAKNELSALGVFPNPTSGTVQLSWEEPLEDDARLQVLDLLGSVVLERSIPAGARTAPVELEGLKNAIYLLKLTQGGSQRTSRVILVQD